MHGDLAQRKKELKSAPIFQTGSKSNRVSQMPCRVSSDVHEWTNEGPAVPIYDPANLRKLDEQSSNFHRGEKSLWSFTAACCCDSVAVAECNG